VIISRTIRWFGHATSIGVVRNVYETLVGKPERKTSFMIPMITAGDNIKFGLNETGCQGVE
jgi:hypothetical protein